MPITFKNVTGVTTSAGSSALKNAGSLFGKAFDTFTGQAQKAQDTRVSTNTETALNKLRQLSTVQDFDAAQGEFDADVLTKQFGKGNFDLGAINKAVSGARDTIISRDIKNLNLQRQQKDIVDNDLIDKALLNRDPSKTLREQNNAIASEIGEQVGSSKLNAALATNVQQFNRSNTIQDTQINSALASRTADVKTIRDEDIQNATEAFKEQNKRIKLNAPKSPEESAQEVTNLNTYLLKNFEDGTFSFGIGNQEGGTALIENVDNLLNQGIKLKNGSTKLVEPWMIRQVLGSAADFEDKILDDSSVDLKILRNSLKTLLEKNPNERLKDEKKTLRDAFNFQKKAIRSESASAVSRFTATARRAAGLDIPTNN